MDTYRTRKTYDENCTSGLDGNSISADCVGSIVHERWATLRTVERQRNDVARGRQFGMLEPERFKVPVNFYSLGYSRKTTCRGDAGSKFGLDVCWFTSGLVQMLVCSEVSPAKVVPICYQKPIVVQFIEESSSSCYHSMFIIHQDLKRTLGVSASDTVFRHRKQPSSGRLCRESSVDPPKHSVIERSC